MIGYIKALENIADAIWYLEQVADITDDDCQKVLQGLQQASSEEALQKSALTTKRLSGNVEDG